MKLLVLTTVVVAALASVSGPALAKHRHHPANAGVTVYGPGPGYGGPPNVYSGGTYVGSDPDPRMRAQLLSDYNRGVDSLGSR
jgi:hypothetical protein